MNEALNSIRKLFLPEYFTVRKMYDIGEKYLFYIARNEEEGEEILDPWYTFDKQTKKITGFVVHQNLPLFKKVMASKPVYTA